MKKVNEISVNVTQESYGQGDKRKTWAFVSSVMSLYHQGTDIAKLDGIKSTCIQYHATINGFSEKEYTDRLNMIRKITEVPKMPGLYASYRNANEALRVACGELCNLQHDYGLVQPRNYNTGELERIKRDELERLEHHVDHKAHVNALKGLFE